MKNYLLTFDILRTSEELIKLRTDLGDDNCYPIGFNSHAYLVKFEGSSADLAEYLVASGSVYLFEQFFIAEVHRWCASLASFQKRRIPKFLGEKPDEFTARDAFA